MQDEFQDVVFKVLHSKLVSWLLVRLMHVQMVTKTHFSYESASDQFGS